LTLEDSLRSRSRAELEECYAFWIGGEPPRDRENLLRRLIPAMQRPERVRSRIRSLSPRVLEVLATALADPAYNVGPGILRRGGSSQPDYELDAALSSLVRRGFLGLARDGNGGMAPEFVYTIPGELGDAAAGPVRELVGASDPVRTLADFTAEVSLRDLRLGAGRSGARVAKAGREEILRALAAPETVAARAGALADPRAAELFRRALVEFGGILPRSLFERRPVPGLAWDGGRLRSLLEEAMLGTCVRVFLEEFGINLMEETVLVFAEIVRSHHLAEGFEPGPIDRVAEAGVNLLSDLSRLLAELRSAPARVTRGNRLFRTFGTRFKEKMVFRPERFLSRDEALDTLNLIVLDLGIARIRPDRRLVPTDASRRFEDLTLFEKLRRVLGAVLFRPEEGESPFHLESLRRFLVDALAGLVPGRWYDPMAAPFLARNRYLANLGRLGIRTKYENVCRYSGPPTGGEPSRMAWSLYEFLRRRLFPFGLVDLALRGDRIVGVRLTELGAVVFGTAEPDESGAAFTPLVVNPDFEILLYPEGRDYALMHRLDQIATRTKSDHIHHYHLTRESVSRAVASGISVRDILETLEANSRNPIPQNVAFSIREWADRVRYVTVRRGRHLVAEDAATVERILEIPAIQRVLRERIDARTLALTERADHPAIVQALAEIAVYLH